jgi:hypothetical protein
MNKKSLLKKKLREEKITKKILMLNYEFPPLGGGASPVSYEIKKSLNLFVGLLDAQKCTS